MIFSKIDSEKVIKSYREDIKETENLMKELQEEITELEKLKKLSTAQKQIRAFNKTEIIRLKTAVDAKQLFLSTYTERIRVYDLKKKQQVKEMELNMKTYLKIAKRESSNYRTRSSEERKRLKQIITQSKNKKLSNDQMLNLFNVLKQRLILYKLIKK